MLYQIPLLPAPLSITMLVFSRKGSLIMFQAGKINSVYCYTTEL